MENDIKKSWRDVSINEYFELKEKLEDITEPTDEIIIKIAFANNITEDDVWNKNINEFQKLKSSIKWMESFNIDQNVKFKTIKLEDEKYNIDTNLQNFTVAQYIDFQTFYSQRKTNERLLGNILSCFIIPKGKQYNDGYDISELINKINNNLDIMTANEIMFFFLKQYLLSIQVLANYFNWKMRKLKRKYKKNKEKVMEIEKEWDMTKKSILDGLHLLTM